MINMPNVENIIVDPEKNITYRIMAYRTLAREEKVAAVRVFLANLPKTKRPKKNQDITFVTTIGSRD